MELKLTEHSNLSISEFSTRSRHEIPLGEMNTSTNPTIPMPSIKGETTYNFQFNSLNFPFIVSFNLQIKALFAHQS